MVVDTSVGETKDPVESDLDRARAKRVTWSAVERRQALSGNGSGNGPGLQLRLWWFLASFCTLIPPPIYLSQLVSGARAVLSGYVIVTSFEMSRRPGSLTRCHAQPSVHNTHEGYEGYDM